MSAETPEIKAVSPDLGKEYAQLLRARVQLEDALAPMIEQMQVEYILMIVSPEPPGFLTFASSLDQDRAVFHMEEAVIRLKAGEIFEDPTEPRGRRRGVFGWLTRLLRRG